MVNRVLPGWIRICAARGHHPRPVSRSELLRFQTLVAVWLLSPSPTTDRSAGAQASAPSLPSSVGLPPIAKTPHALLGVIESHDAQMDDYEISELHVRVRAYVQRIARMRYLTNIYRQDLALSCIPLQDLHEQADKIQSGPDVLPCFEDALAQAAVEWFKHSFFRWVDPIQCPTCQGSTSIRDMVHPNTEEINGKAGRVELHVCQNPVCGGSFRFPRYK